MIQKLCASLLMISPVANAAEPQVLFNGRDFEGWTFDVLDPEVKPEAVWSVADGMLVCKGRPPGVIRTLKDYSNYELIVEWRWAPGGKPGNSGVLIHASKPREMFVWPKSVEVQLAHENAGDFWVIGETLSVANSQAQGRRWWKKGGSREKPPGEWNRARIRCEGRKVTTWINGSLMNEGIDLSATRGAICLQSEQGEVQFRKIELTPIE
ncbi:DUF1080 domain-containing protein [bacterium]|nr:DUF1080 domain-containing protein [bacterium]